MQSASEKNPAIDSGAPPSIERRLDSGFMLGAILWTAFILALATWNYQQARSLALTKAHIAARESIGKDLAYRKWAARHGGVYVPVTPETLPNPHLAHIAERDITTPSGKTLTLVNPAQMTRQAHELAAQRFGTRGHITSLRPLRPENAPDDWEEKALLAFEHGAKEVWSIDPIEQEPFLRLMQPMAMEPECLKCHQAQGYRVGDIRGGISVAVPWRPYQAGLLAQRRGTVLGFGGIWVLGILGLGFSRKHFRRHLVSSRVAEQAVRESERKFRTLFGSMAEGVALHTMIYDEAGQAIDYRIVDINPAYTKHTGLPAVRARGALASELYGSGSPPFLCEYERVARGGEPFLSETYFAPLERHFSISAISPEPGQFATFFEDISARKRQEQQLSHQATHDALTGLANRVLLADRLRQSLLFAERSQRIVAVLLFDLDRFKVINESLGHSRGDELLQQVALRLSSCVRDCDTVARLGGDEFVVVLAEVAEVDDLGLLTKRFTDALDAPFALAGRELHLTASIGISLFPRDGRDHETLVRNADNAMYRAKEEGSGTFAFFSPEMNVRVQETLEMEADLHRALERNEFVVHYQPKIGIASGGITGCEALVRWRHPRRGLVPPGDFIPLAEETGLIVPLGAWVLQEACAQAKRWEEEGLPAVKMAVNLSARQFRQAGLAEQVQRVLATTGLAPDRLELELTESMIMHDPAGAAETMRKLKGIGIALCLDDFGTGYSSLNYLRRFPVDYLKIDRSFITDMTTDASGAAVAISVVTLAHGLGIYAVAEGVETWEQHDSLASCRCDELQGFLFSRPLPAEDLAQLLRENRRLVRN